MSDTVSVDELTRETSRWPSRWRPALGEEGEWDGFWWCQNKEGEDRVSAGADEDYANDFARFVADMVNAMPAFLAIAKAALELKQQEQIAAKTRVWLARQEEPTDADYARVDHEDRKLKQCRDAYEAALSGVTL